MMLTDHMSLKKESEHFWKRKKFNQVANGQNMLEQLYDQELGITGVRTKRPTTGVQNAKPQQQVTTKPAKT